MKVWFPWLNPRPRSMAPSRFLPGRLYLRAYHPLLYLFLAVLAGYSLLLVSHGQLAYLQRHQVHQELVSQLANQWLLEPPASCAKVMAQEVGQAMREPGLAGIQTLEPIVNEAGQ